MFAFCPQRHELKQREIPSHPLNQRYKAAIRQIIVKFYNELMDGNMLTYNEIRKVWSSYWKNVDDSLLIDRPLNHGKNFGDFHLTDEESAMIRGLNVLKIIVDRKIHRACHTPPEILLVDENFSIDIEDVTITGKIDVVMSFVPNRLGAGHKEDPDKYKLWVVDWDDSENAGVKHDLKHSLQIYAASKLLNLDKPFTGLLVDSIKLGRDVIQSVYHSNATIERSLKESVAITKALSQHLVYRHISPSCFTLCPYTDSCFNIKVARKTGPNRGRKYRGDLPVGVTEKTRI